MHPTLPVPAAASQGRILPVNVQVLDGVTAEIDGVRVSFDSRYIADEPSVDYAGGMEIYFDFATAVVANRADWDDAHPGVEPTPAALRAIIDEAAEEVADIVIDRTRDDFDPPDADDYYGEDY